MSTSPAYLTTTKSLAGVLNSIKKAQAPDRFSIRFLEEMGFKSKTDRLMIGVLKGLGFLTDTGVPTARYFEFLDGSQSGRVLAEGIREAYADLFRVNTEANKLSQEEVAGKLKTLLQGSKSDGVVKNMAMTFVELCKLANFDESIEEVSESEPADDELEETDPVSTVPLPNPILTQSSDRSHVGGGLGIRQLGLSYDIHLHLPASRDAAVYEVLFKSLKEHLL